MRARIHKSLLMMGVISVALAFLLAIILHYQSMQEQADRELARVAQTAAAAVSMEKAPESKAYLDAIYDGNNKDIHIVWLTDKGSILTIPMKLLEGTISRCPKSGRRSGRDPGKSFINRLMSIRKVMWRTVRPMIPFFVFQIKTISFLSRLILFLKSSFSFLFFRGMPCCGGT